MDEQLSEKGFVNFLKTNSKIFIYGLITLILVIVAYSWFSYNSNQQKVKISEDFIKAKILLANENKTDAKEILTKIVEGKNTVYSSLSLFLIIDKKLIEDKEIILNYFDLVISSSSYSDEDINLLKLKKAIYISDINQEQEMLELLNPIINSSSVWKIQTLKFLGDFYFSLKQFKKAKQHYTLLLKEDNNNASKSEIERKINFIDNG